MIKCRLSTIMGERRLKIADVERGSGVHRNIVTRYYNDEIAMMSKDVIDRLCAFLKISPGELLQRVPPIDVFYMDDGMRYLVEVEERDGSWHAEIHQQSEHAIVGGKGKAVAHYTLEVGNEDDALKQAEETFRKEQEQR